MRNDHLLAEAAVVHHADRIGFVAKVVLAILAALTDSATQPRENNTQVADRDTAGLRANFGNPPDNFMAGRARQFHATLSQQHDLARPHVVGAFPEVKIGMAHAAMRHGKNDLGPLRVAIRNFDALKRRAIFYHCPCFHHVSC